VFDVIVVPTDGSEHAERAADRAIDLAAIHDATVHVICVADTGPISAYRLPGEAESAAAAIRDRTEEFVETIAARVETAGVDVTTAIPEGPAKNEIVSYADEVDADLIVMGTRGRGGVERALLGSVAEHVVRVSDVDVLVVGDEE
jgi:nucleotide-binding universal stress UspA family protein